VRAVPITTRTYVINLYILRVPCMHYLDSKFPEDTRSITKHRSFSLYTLS
jgi:hypothetical protein